MTYQDSTWYSHNVPPDTCQDHEPLEGHPTPDAPIRIGVILRETGVTRATVHHYVAEGLLPAPTKTGRNMALYSPCCVERVRLVRRLQAERRHSLSEAREIITAAPTGADLADLRQALDAEVASADPLTESRPQEDLTLQALCERTGLAWAEVDELDRLGVLPTHRAGGTRLVAPAHVAIADRIATLIDTTGDRTEVLAYIGRLSAAVTALVEAEGDCSPTLAQAATPLMVALRRQARR